MKKLETLFQPKTQLQDICCMGGYTEILDFSQKSQKIFVMKNGNKKNK